MKSLQYPGVRLQQVGDEKTRAAMKSLDGHVKALYDFLNASINTEHGPGILRTVAPLVLPDIGHNPMGRSTRGVPGQLARAQDHIFIKTGGVGEDTDWDEIPLGSTAFGAATGVIGLVASNGVATSYMRSDAAPALSQNIAPDWTGVHRWSNYVEYDEMAAPGTPVANRVRLYAKDNGAGVSSLYFKKDDGTEVDLGNPGSGTIGGSGTLNYIPIFTPDGVTLGNSAMFDDTAGSIVLGANFIPAGAGFALGTLGAPWGGIYMDGGGITAVSADLAFETDNSIGPSQIRMSIDYGADDVQIRTTDAWLTLDLLSTGASSEFRIVAPASAGRYTAFKTQTQAGAITYTLPAADAAGALTSDGVGSLSWASYLSAGAIGATVQAWDADLDQIAAVNNVQGDILITNSGPTWVRLGKGATAGMWLRSDGTDVAWSTTTIPNSATTGDLLYASGSNAYANLADVATGNALISGGVGVAPSWGKIALSTHVSGTLQAANFPALTGEVTTSAGSLATTIDKTIGPTWTGTHTFNTNRDVHNAGVSLGTSGRLDSSVADAASAISFLYKPSVSLTSGTDRYIHSFQDSSGNVGLTMQADGTWVFGGSNLSGNYILATGTMPSTVNRGMNFNVTWGASGGTTVAGFATSVVGFQAAGNDAAGTTATGVIAGAFINNTIAGRAHSNIVGGVFSPAPSFSAGSFAHGNIYGWRVRGAGTIMGGTATAIYGGYVDAMLTGATPATTDAYGLYVEEQVQATNKYGLWLASATAGYKALAIGSTSNWIAWESSTTWSLNATTVIFKADADHSAKNIVTDTTTGTKIGTGTTQKLGFFNATPVVQPTDGSTLTNNVTSGGTTDTIANYTDLVIYANDAAAIRNNLYQLARKVKIITDNLRTLGLES